jgi:hypothetical protein
LVEAIAVLPGVEAVALSTHIPLSGNYSTQSVVTDERTPLAPEGLYSAAIVQVSPGYVGAIKLRLQGGRLHRPGRLSLATGGDREPYARRRALARQDPSVVSFASSEDGPDRRSCRGRGHGEMVLIGAPRAMMYVPLRQVPSQQTYLIVKSRGEDPSALVPSVRSAVASVNPNILLYGVRTMATHLDQGIALFFVNMGATLATAIGLLGLLQTIVGLYGVLSYSVAQRSKEFGIKMALGARSGMMIREVLRQSAALVAVGIVVGGALALGLTRMMGSVLVGVSPTDALSYGGALALVSALALASSYIPAWRASRVAPAVVVRGTDVAAPRSREDRGRPAPSGSSRLRGFAHPPVPPSPRFASVMRREQYRRCARSHCDALSRSPPHHAHRALPTRASCPRGRGPRDRPRWLRTVGQQRSRPDGRGQLAGQRPRAAAAGHAPSPFGGGRPPRIARRWRQTGDRHRADRLGRPLEHRLLARQHAGAPPRGRGWPIRLAPPDEWRVPLTGSLPGAASPMRVVATIRARRDTTTAWHTRWRIRTLAVETLRYPRSRNSPVSTAERWRSRSGRTANVNRDASSRAPRGPDAGWSGRIPGSSRCRCCR